MGKLICADGMKADPKKVLAIQAFPPPPTVQELQRFLGMVNYLGQFVVNLSLMSAPLRQLLRSAIEFQWNPEQEQAFNDVLFVKL